MRKPTFSMYKNEDADQLLANHTTFRSASLWLQRESVPELGMIDPIIIRARMEKPINLILITNIHQQACASQ